MEEHEIGTGSGILNLVVARSELGATFTCKVSSLALAEPLKIDIKLDVHGKTTIKIISTDHFFHIAVALRIYIYIYIYI
jgi:hypothetical protein